MKKLILLLPFLLLPLTGCDKDIPLPTPSEPDVTDGNDERNYRYTNKLVKPSFTVSNMKELSAAVDYCAFYKIEYFDITLNNYVWSTRNNVLKEELNYLYWYGELVNSVMGMNAQAIKNNVWRFQLTFYKNAYKDTEETKVQLNQIIDFKFAGDRDDSWNNFATDDPSKPVVDVATTQQLWYAVEHGYRVNPIEYSPADYYYDQAKDLLRHNVLSTASSEEKMASIYDLIISTCQYDYEALDYPEPQNPDLYPDETCAGYKAFFLEGYFDNNLLVCDGYAKLATLLGRMEGIEIVRGTGTHYTAKDWKSRSVSGHGYTYFKNTKDNKWYLACPTWSHINVPNTSYYVLTHTYFFASKALMYTYENTNWQDLNYATKSNYSYYSARKYTYQDKEYDLLLDTVEEANAALETLKKSQRGFIDFCVNPNIENEVFNEITNLITNGAKENEYQGTRLNVLNYTLYKL